MSKRIAVLAGFRTPFVKAGGVLKASTAVELGVSVVAEAIARFPFLANETDEFIAGNVAQPADSMNIARVIALHGGVNKAVPAYTVHRNCASGMEAVSQAVTKIRAGEGELYMCLGVESMSNIPLLFKKDTQNIFENIFKAKTALQKIKAISQFRPKHFAPEIGVKLGLTDPVCGLIMGLTAENIANDFGISRKEQDEFSCRSHALASKALQDKIFADEIHHIFSKSTNQMISDDDGIRHNQAVEGLAKLKPFFERNNGSVTVGNSSQITDGACILIITPEEKAKSLGIEPLGFIKDFAYAGCDGSRMGLGPVFATQKILAKNKMQLSDFENFEINEAFAAQVLGCLKAMDSQKFFDTNLNGVEKLGEIDTSKLNIHGGAIALGHPVGASGARILIHTLHTIRRNNAQNALATICIGGGQGASFILENK
jgi:acetyl-CoA C-acetyltransferase